jgi:hypothetical protein
VNPLDLSLRNTHSLSVHCAINVDTTSIAASHANMLKKIRKNKKKMEEMANRQKQSGGQGQAGEQEATELTGTEPPEAMGETESIRE